MATPFDIIIKDIINNLSPNINNKSIQDINAMNLIHSNNKSIHDINTMNLIHSNNKSIQYRNTINLIYNKKKKSRIVTQYLVQILLKIIKKI